MTREWLERLGRPRMSSRCRRGGGAAAARGRGRRSRRPALPPRHGRPGRGADRASSTGATSAAPTPRSTSRCCGASSRPRPRSRSSPRTASQRPAAAAARASPQPALSPSTGTTRAWPASSARHSKGWSGPLPELELVGAGGEPVDFRRTLASHGVAELLPNRLDEQAWTLETTLAVDGRAHTLRVSEGRPRIRRVDGGAPARASSVVPPHAAARRGPVALLRDDRRRRPARLGQARGGPDAAQPDRLRGRRQDGLHDQLRLVGDGAHGHRARRAPRRRRAAPSPRRRRWPRRPTTSTGTSRAPATAGRTCARSPPPSPTARSTSRRSTAAATCPTTRSPSGCWRCPASARTRPRTS